MVCRQFRPIFHNMHVRTEPGPWAPRHLVGFDLRRRPHLEADVLVVGGGVAGLCAALAAADGGKEVLLLVKGDLSDSNTAWAQGGVAAVLNRAEREAEDTIEKHVQDTLSAGAGLCDEAVVRDLIGEGALSIDFLRRHGEAMKRLIETVRMPNGTAENLIMFIRQNAGKLPIRRREMEFAFLTDAHVEALETIVNEAFKSPQP